MWMVVVALQSTLWSTERLSPRFCGISRYSIGVCTISDKNCWRWRPSNSLEGVSGKSKDSRVCACGNNPVLIDQLGRRCVRPKTYSSREDCLSRYLV
ncbi:hypothetical protein LZ30DRAFT_720313 [Colletotrichum cereale]|nr:hypothetical protein LZ30DRAFT_720313 [Colletotrichum cereale]